MNKMDYKAAIKEMIAAKGNGFKQKHLAAMLGFASQAAVGNIMSRPDITLDTLIRICDALDYNIVLQPKRNKISENEIKLTRSELKKSESSKTVDGKGDAE